VAAVFHELDPPSRDGRDGGRIVGQTGTTFATAHGPARALLAGERVALNFLQRLSGVATITRRAVDAVRGTGARITHTRKTTPGLRDLELYAVRVGGGVTNRTSLADAVLWKDNHWALLDQDGRSLADALRGAGDHAIIVEVESDAQLDTALAAGVKHVLVDNQSPEQVAEWARRAGPKVTIQASGGITPDTARAYAEAGAALIAIGALTHSAPAAPIRCEITAADRVTGNELSATRSSVDSRPAGAPDRPASARRSDRR
jgi:nicotinate-nucleotide pyrophosphorylase (carboxylating)